MKSVEFKTVTHNGIIEIPKENVEIKNKEVKVTIVWDEQNGKNYDIFEIEKLLAAIRTKKIFEEIKNPSDWQKKIRDDWE